MLKNVKINLSDIDTSQFIVTEYELHDSKMYLTIPQHMGCKWTAENIIFRSSLWDINGNPINLSFKKFFNFLEQPDIEQFPDNLNNCSLIDKLDGTLLAFSRYKDNIIVRTRGTVNAYLQLNADELEVLKHKYPDAWLVPDGMTWIFEWLSDTNKIVLSYRDVPDMYFIGQISHVDYSYTSQATLDQVAAIHGFKRPKRYSFNSISDMLESIKALDGIEGICVYYPVNGKLDNGIRKVKSASYLALHGFKSNCSIASLVDLYFELGRPSYTDFVNEISSKFDWECANMALPFISKICTAAKAAEAILSGMRRFVEPLRGLSRKDAAAKIISSYGQTNRSGYAFTLLDNKPLDDSAYKKLLFQCLGGT